MMASSPFAFSRTQAPSHPSKKLLVQGAKRIRLSIRTPSVRSPGTHWSFLAPGQPTGLQLHQAPGCVRRCSAGQASRTSGKSGSTSEWQRQVQLEPGESVKKTYRVGKSIYVTTSESRIVRIEADTGILRWSNGLGRENFDIYKPIELKGADNAPTGEVLVVSARRSFHFQHGDRRSNTPTGAPGHQRFQPIPWSSATRFASAAPTRSTGFIWTAWA